MCDPNGYSFDTVLLDMVNDAQAGPPPLDFLFILRRLQYIDFIVCDPSL